jgi:hypothetical protein
MMRRPVFFSIYMPIQNSKGPQTTPSIAKSGRGLVEPNREVGRPFRPSFESTVGPRTPALIVPLYMWSRPSLAVWRFMGGILVLLPLLEVSTPLERPLLQPNAARITRFQVRLELVFDKLRRWNRVCSSTFSSVIRVLSEDVLDRLKKSRTS